MVDFLINLLDNFMVEYYYIYDLLIIFLYMSNTYLKIAKVLLKQYPNKVTLNTATETLKTPQALTRERYEALINEIAGWVFDVLIDNDLDELTEELGAEQLYSFLAEEVQTKMFNQYYIHAI